VTCITLSWSYLGHSPLLYGTISNIDTAANTCDVQLDSVTSSIQNLDLNFKPTLSAIPIEYMTCNAGAFSDGDSVIVAFENHSWSSPKVVGFKDHPKGCYPYVVIRLGSEAIVWDIAANDILPLPGINQPASAYTIISKLSDMGFTDRADAAGVDLGRCLIPDGEITIGNLPYTSTTVSAGDKQITYTVNQTDTTEKKNELDLVDSGEIFEAEFKEIITQHAVRTNIYDDIYYRILISSVSNSESVVDVQKYKEAVGRIYAATLDPAMISKRKAGFYYTTGEFVYTKEHHGAWGGNSTYTYSVDYTKRYHYKSYFDGSKSQEDIFEITASHTESETIPSTVRHRRRCSRKRPPSAILWGWSSRWCRSRAPTGSVRMSHWR
jgi:hypothetical protein